jgi:hypothetical protein
MNKIEKKLNRIGGLMALAFLIGMLFVGIYKRHLLPTHFQFTKGIVTEITPAGWKSSGDYSILYQYWVKDKAYCGNSNYNFCRG